MKSRIAFVVCVLLIVGWASFSTAAEPPPPAGWATPTVATVPVSVVVASTEVEGRLKWKQRRALGVTVKNVRRILKEMDANGELEGKGSSVLAVEVLTQLVEEKPQAFQEIGERDWEAILEAVIAFLEKLIPLIIMFLGLL